MDEKVVTDEVASAVQMALTGEVAAVARKKLMLHVRNWTVPTAMDADSLRHLAEQFSAAVERLTKEREGPEPEELIEGFFDKVVRLEAHVAELQAENEAQKAIIANLTAELEAARKPPAAAE